MLKHPAGAVLLLGTTLSSALVPGTPPRAQQAERVDFARDVRPILQQRCYECHGPEQQKNGFRLDRRKDAMQGGTIAVIGPGNSEGSRLYHRLIGDKFGRQMPPDGALPAAQVATIKAWIDQGAEWPDELAGDEPPPPPDCVATELMTALRAGDSRRVTKLLARHAEAINRKGPGGATPLMQAVLYGDTATVRRLLDRGADPNVADEGGATPLMWAVGDLEKARVLLDRGASVRVRSALGLSPLLIAAAIPGATPVVQLLLDRGADPSEKVPGFLGETTPLLQAAYNGDASTFQLLVARGANVTSAGFATLGLALRAQCQGCVETMLKHLDADAVTAIAVEGSPPFGPALATAMLLERGADPHARDVEGRTLLMLAAASDELPVGAVRMLIARGADVNARTASGETALRLATLRGDTPVTKLLLAAARPPGGRHPGQFRHDLLHPARARCRAASRRRCNRRHGALPQRGAARGRLVVRSHARDSAPAALRVGIPARPRSVHLRRGHQLGDDGVESRRPLTAHTRSGDHESNRSSGGQEVITGDQEIAKGSQDMRRPEGNHSRSKTITLAEQNVLLDS